MNLRPSPQPAYDDDSVRVFSGRALDVLRSIPDATIHSVVTDPPYAIDSTSEANEQQLSDAPMLGMQSSNWHEKATHSRGYADNDPRQFQRWCEGWLAECLRVLKPGGHLVAFGGTRTWHRLVVAAEDSGFEIRDSMVWLNASGVPKGLDASSALKANGHPDAATTWEGWSTAVKPGHEPILLARKPLEGTVAENLLQHKTGALNLGACRLQMPASGGRQRSKWATNVHMSSGAAAVLAQTAREPLETAFFVSKPQANERVKVNGVEHPTVKPLDLMRHLVRLVTPPGGTVIDPFAGSGTTLEAALMEAKRVIGVERDAAYLPLILERIRRRAHPFQPDLQDENVLTLPL